MTSSKVSIALLLIIAGTLFSSSLSQAADSSLSPYEAVEPRMGTLFRIKLYAPNATVAQQAFRAAFDRVAQLDEVLSDYRPHSELSRITNEAVASPVHVSDDLFRVVQASQQLSGETDGAFDLTIGALTHLWREARRNGAPPTVEAVQSALARSGYRKLHLDAAARTIRFDAPQMLLDAGGIAKGYAADEALKVLANLSVHSALVAASGDLAFGDAPPGQRGWKVGIDSFDSADRPFTHVLVLSNAAVSTSGKSEQHLETAGKTYSHIIDPNTGMGLLNDLTVTTIARRGITADAAATAISVLGCEKGLEYVARQRELAAFILVKNGDRTSSFASTRFQDLLRDKSSAETNAENP